MSDEANPFQKLFATSATPELGPGPRAGVTPLAGLNHQIDAALAHRAPAAAAREQLRALVLLWHDHHDAAHQIVQDLENTDGSYVHAILHRREPDFDNARYWFRRVGRHTCFSTLAQRVENLLRTAPAPGLARKLLARSAWDAFAFIEACEEVEGRPVADPQTSLLRSIQAIEFEVLLEHLAALLK